MIDITLYTTGCPKCNILKAKMNAAGILYKECTDVDTMSSLGIMQSPMLRVFGNLLDFKEAIAFVNSWGSSGDEV